MVEAKDVAIGFAELVAAVFFLYVFLVSLDIMGSSFTIIAGGQAGSLFGETNNPFLGLTVGILATVLLQSSSTSTSITVTLVASNIITPAQATFIIFGANIGTSVTNTIVSLGFINNREQMRRGFAGATVHDMFNYMNVLLLFPIEAIVGALTIEGLGPLGLLGQAIATGYTNCNSAKESCSDFKSPIKQWTGDLTAVFIKPNKDIVTDFAQGRPTEDLCPLPKGFTFKTKVCFANTTDLGEFASKKYIKEICAQPDASGVIKNANKAATFFFCNSSEVANATVLEAAQEHYDNFDELNPVSAGLAVGMGKGGGWLMLFVSLFLLCASLLALVKVLGLLLRGKVEATTKKVLNYNGYLNILFGALMTMAVQSSSVTTSALTPLCALGVITLESMLPFTLGANIGTTITGVLSALVATGSSANKAFQVAMVHVFFNVVGVFIWYPIPFIRNIPLTAARNLGDLAATYRVFPFLYLFFIFFLYPALLLGIFVGLTSGEGGKIAGGVIGLITLLAINAGFLFWYKFRDGKKVLMERFGSKDEDYVKKEQAHEDEEGTIKDAHVTSSSSTTSV